MYICPLCGDTLDLGKYEIPGTCNRCRNDYMVSFVKFLLPEETFNIRGHFLKVQDIPYEHLIDLYTDPVIGGTFHLHQPIIFHLSYKEYKIVKDLPLEDLPLHINDNWVTEIGAESFKHRLLTGEDPKPLNMEAYFMRYLVHPEKKEASYVF
jgi:hypothetical protein